MIEGVFYIESQGKNESIVKKALEDMVERMKAEEGVKVKNVTYGGVVKEGKTFSSTVEVEVEFASFKDYLLSAVKYGPSAITLDSPEKLVLRAAEFLQVVGELTALTKRFRDKYGISYTYPEEIKNLKIGLEEDEIEGLLDQGALRIKLVVESLEKEDVAKNRLLASMSKDAFVHRVKTSSVEDSSLVAVHAFVYEPKTLVDLSVNHLPVLIEIIEPDKIKLSLFEIQDIGVELAATYFELSHMALYRGFPS